MRAAQDSVRSAAEGNPTAMAQAAASMASSATRGAYESAKLVMDTLSGGMMGMGGGYGQEQRSDTGKAFERVGDSMSDAAGRVGGAMSDAAATMSGAAASSFQQAAAGYQGNTPQPTGPESTYDEHALRHDQVPSPAAASPEEVKEQALGDAWAGTPSDEAASYGRPITEDTGIFGTTQGVGDHIEFVEPGEQLERDAQKGQIYTKLQRAQGDNVRSVDDDAYVMPTDDSLGKKA